MNLQGIVAVSGKPGLWKALSQNKTGFILESLDAQKTKLVANLSTAKLAALDEITVFGYSDDIKLTDVFEKMKAAANVPDSKADGKQLRAFFLEVAPDHDEEKVYSSDMKKIVTWFHILKELPLFNEAPTAEAPATEETEATAETAKAAAAVKKQATTTAPKATAKQSAPKASAKPKATAKARRAE